MKRILIIANSDSAIYKFRMELIKALSEKYRIGLAIPFGQYMSEIKNDRFKFFDVPVNRHGTNPAEDLKLLKRYTEIINNFKPDAALLYTVKPNIYGSIACARRGILSLCNITGLGTAVENPGALRKLLIHMYRFAMKKENTIFFQNEHSRDFFRTHKIGKEEQYHMLPGSGVNLDRFRPIEYPADKTVRYLFVARIIKEKGIDEFLESAKRFKEQKLDAEFHICGACEEDYEGSLKEFNDKGMIVYHGLVKDMREMYKMSSCVVLPSYYPEGQSNVLLEGAASARPLVTTDHPGCREAVDDGINGFLVKKQSADDLYDKLKRIYDMPLAERAEMGRAGRAKMEKEFDRRIIVKAYLDELGKAIG